MIAWSIDIARLKILKMWWDTTSLRLTLGGSQCIGEQFLITQQNRQNLQPNANNCGQYSISLTVFYFMHLLILFLPFHLFIRLGVAARAFIGQASKAAVEGQDAEKGLNQKEQAAILQVISKKLERFDIYFYFRFFQKHQDACREELVHWGGITRKSVNKEICPLISGHILFSIRIKYLFLNLSVL